MPELEHEATVGHVAALLVSVMPLEDASHLARFEAVTAVLLKIRVVCDMTPGECFPKFGRLLLILSATVGSPWAEQHSVTTQRIHIFNCLFIVFW